MNEAGIEIQFGYEDEYLLRLLTTVNNGEFQGHLEWYCYPDELKEIGNVLSSFPQKIPDEYLYEFGSERPKDNMLYYFAINAYTLNKSGHCALRIAIKVNKDKPDEGECRFSIIAEPWAIHRLGELLKEFAKLKYTLLKWSLNPENDILE